MSANIPGRQVVQGHASGHPSTWARRAWEEPWSSAICDSST